MIQSRMRWRSADSADARIAKARAVTSATEKADGNDCSAPTRLRSGFTSLSSRLTSASGGKSWRRTWQRWMDTRIHEAVLWLGLMLAWGLCPGIGKRETEVLDE